MQRAIRLSEADARAKEEERRRQMARRQQEQDLFDFNTPTAQTNVTMYPRSDSMSSMGYGQGYYNQQTFGGDFSGMGNAGFVDPNPFGVAQAANDPFGSNPFGAAFDGGSGARPLPHQVSSIMPGRSRSCPDSLFHSDCRRNPKRSNCFDCPKCGSDRSVCQPCLESCAQHCRNVSHRIR